MEPVVVIDFETTGLSPDHGARVTEIAAVLVRDGHIVDRYQSLMNAGQRIPPFIQSLTGITNNIIRQAPPAAQVMAEVADFVGSYPLVAHNASFDRKFWEAELARIGYQTTQTFACSMLVARRLLPGAPNHKLGTLVTYARLPITGRHHRALADAEMAAHLTLFLEHTLVEQFQLCSVSHGLLQRIQRTRRNRLNDCLRDYP
jgi:DNA polymerase III subunit epsilon